MMKYYDFIAEIEDVIEYIISFELSDEMYKLINDKLDAGYGLEDIEEFTEYEALDDQAYNELMEIYLEKNEDKSENDFDNLVDDIGIMIYPNWR